jgi:hypothetical protein
VRDGESNIVTNRCIEIVIDRLMTDEGFRWRFLTDPNTALIELLEGRTELSVEETAALLGTNPALLQTVDA